MLRRSRVCFRIPDLLTDFRRNHDDAQLLSAQLHRRAHCPMVMTNAPWWQVCHGHDPYAEERVWNQIVMINLIKIISNTWLICFLHGIAASFLDKGMSEATASMCKWPLAWWCKLFQLNSTAFQCSWQPWLPGDPGHCLATGSPNCEIQWSCCIGGGTLNRDLDFQPNQSIIHTVLCCRGAEGLDCPGRWRSKVTNLWTLSELVSDGFGSCKTVGFLS